MLLHQQHLYNIIHLSNSNEELNTVIQLNASNAIFEGHFPGQPVLPGVCMLQISQEIIEQVLGEKLIMKQTGQIKFLQMVDPRLTNIINITIKIKNEPLSAQVEWSAENDAKILKYNATYEKL